MSNDIKKHALSFKEELYLDEFMKDFDLNSFGKYEPYIKSDLIVTLCDSSTKLITRDFVWDALYVKGLPKTKEEFDSISDPFKKGVALMQGKVVKQDLEKGFKLIAKAAYDNNLRAKEYFATLVYLNKDAEEFDEITADEFTLNAEDLGSKCLLPSVANLYTKGYTVEQDLEQAHFFHKRALMAGYSTMLSEVAEDFLYGRGVKVDIDKAIKYFDASVDVKEPDGMATFAELMLFNEDMRSFKKAFLILKDLYEHDHAKAASIYATILYNQDRKYQQATYQCAMNGASKDNSQALFILAIMTARGQACKADKSLSFKYLKRAADLRHPKACELAGSWLLAGIGTKVDKKQALEYFYKGAEVRSDECFALAGMCHYRGYGTEKNEEDGLDMISRAAENGCDMAKMWLEYGIPE